MKIHLIGIGGIGVSALAQYYLSKGHIVSGSDLVASEITDFLISKGVSVAIGSSAENIKQSFNLVVHSPAVKADNQEYIKAKEFGIKTQSYPEALGDLTKDYYTIAVAGAHGKSTTTAMIALAMTKAGLDPTVIVGTKVKEFGNSNFRSGKSKFLVIEACEYDSSFLQYSPKIIVVTNVDKEHLDYFKTFANVKKAFKDFITCLPAGRCDSPDGGCLVYNSDDKNIPRFKKPKFCVVGYSLKHDPKGTPAKKIKKLLKVPGQHNVSNALATLQVARALKIPDETTFGSLSEFNGTWRRFEVKEGKAGDKQIIVISDYGHHPNEILATLKATREKYARKKIWCVFQPHQHQRTYYLFNDFIKVFRKAKIDKIIITDIYDVAGRETKIINGEVSSEKLVKKINKKSVTYLSMDKLSWNIKDSIKEGDVLIIMGAGDIYKLADNF